MGLAYSNGHALDVIVFLAFVGLLITAGIVHWIATYPRRPRIDDGKTSDTEHTPQWK